MSRKLAVMAVPLVAKPAPGALEPLRVHLVRVAGWADEEPSAVPEGYRYLGSFDPCQELLGPLSVFVEVTARDVFQSMLGGSLLGG